MSAAPARSTAPESSHLSTVARAAESIRPRLRVVAPLPFEAPRGPFVLVVGALLTLGLLGGLGLNMLVAQDAFALGDLRKESAALADREQALQEEVAIAEGPAELEARARALGMVASVNPVFLRLADGAVLGKTEAPVAQAPRAPAKKKASDAGTAATVTSTTTNTDDGAGTVGAIDGDATTSTTSTPVGDGDGTVGPVTGDGDGEIFDPQAVRTKKAAAQ